MILPKRKYRFARELLAAWERENLISSEQSKKIRGSLEQSGFDWKRLARYSFWFAGISLAISVFAVLLDEVILEILEGFFELPDSAKSIILFIIAGLFYLWGFRRKRKKPEKLYSNEFVLFAGAIVTGAAIALFGIAVDTGSGHYSLLILAGSLVYLSIGALFPSVPMWVLGLISLASWFGTETGYVSGWGAYYLGMNYPLRFVFFGILTIAVSFLTSRSPVARLSRSTYIMGLLYLFLALWLMSIFGNYGDIDTWYSASTGEKFIWSLLFGIAALAAVFWGLKNDDAVSRKFGVTFLFINFYTKYFEYFWVTMHKAVFFAFLGISFWLVGRYAESMVNAIKEKLFDSSKNDDKI